MKKSILIVLLVLPVFNLSSQCGSGTFGNFPPPFTTPGNFGVNYLLGTKHNLGNTSLLTALGYRGNGTGATMRMAIYTNNAGVPGNLVAYTNTVLVGTGNTTISVITPTVIAAGLYWIMADYAGGTGSNHVNYINGGAQTVAYISLPVNTVPPQTSAWTTYNFQDFDYWAVISANLLVSPSSTIVCIGTPVTLSVSGSPTYTWNTNVTNSNITVSPSVTTSYTVSANQGTCTIDVVATVSVNPSPTVSVNSGSICSGNSFLLVPSGANTYTYSSGSNLVSPIVSTSYSITGSSSQGCVSSNTAVSNITVEITPTVSVNNGTICTGNVFTIVPTGASNYTYSSGGTAVSPTISSSYTVTGSSTAGCVSANAAISSVTVFALPTVTASSNRASICAGASGTLTAGGAFSYLWNTSAITNTLVISPSVNTVYTVTGTDVNGCSLSFTLSQVVSPCTGINSELSTLNRQPVIYPNPNNGEFTIVSDQSVQLTLVNELGQNIRSFALDCATEVTVKDLADGIYFLLGTDNSQISRQKIIVRK